MNKTQMIDKLYNEITNQNSNYITIISIMVAIIALVLAVFGLFQWKFSSRQLDKVKEETKNEIVKEYDLSNLGKELNGIKFKLDEMSKEINSITTFLDQKTTDTLDVKIQNLINLETRDNQLPENLKNEISNLLSDIMESNNSIQEKVSLLESKYYMLESIIPQMVASEKVKKDLSQVKNNILSVINQLKKES